MRDVREAARPDDGPAFRELLRRALDPRPRDAFADYIRSSGFPCVGAKAALVQDRITVMEAGDITDPRFDVEIYKGIERFIGTLERDTPVVQSLAVIYPASPEMDEAAFEAAMWERLQCLHNLDAIRGVEWAEDTDADPTSAHFSMSVAGEAFFVVGLHPGAHRPARCFRHPVMVFNSHDQFERMRADGRYDTMKRIIRKRDRALSGSINPVLEDFGNSSEAKQYSGRRRGEAETFDCPFAAKLGAEPELKTFVAED